MKFGIFDFKITNDGNEYFVQCSAQGKHFCNFGPFNTYRTALVLGIEKLKEKIQEAQGALNKPVFGQKSKPVHVQQWWPQDKIEGLTRTGGSYWYRSQRIVPGDWIVNGLVVTNEDFERDYEVTT